MFFKKIMEDKEQKYGVIKYSSINIGDEIQSVAATRFLPRIDYYVQRERIDEFHSNEHEKVKLIMNAWWMWDYKHFPPSEDIEPMFVSFHLREKIRKKYSDTFMSEKVIKYFKSHEPIGCRDIETAKYLQKYGIEAYFSGCLTMTLTPNKKLKERGGNYILCVDVPEKMVAEIRKKAEKPVYCVSRMVSPAFTGVERFSVAKYFLYLYHNAACVVTPRLHVALPSVAFETPVCLVGTKTEKDEILSRRGRFAGMEGFFNEVMIEDYLAGKTNFDINNPLHNPGTHVEMRDSLIEKCKKFTGYDRETPLFDDDYNPLIEMAQLLTYDKKVIERITMFADNEVLIDTLKKKVVEKKSRHDLTY